MKIVIDENLPPALARALSAIFVGTHEVIHLRDRFGPRVSDLEWIKTLSAEGRWIVLSADRRISRNKAEKQAFRSSRLVGFFLSSGLQKAKLVKQAERLLAVWENLEKQVDLAPGGAIYEIPMKSSKLPPI